ncbi:(2Fe-2S)-binding protein [Sphingomonas sp. LHG3406-1]|uniref:(2Fe-2S)-binding protein n=1 Tax=Sphingomonas sp. LHG3406-1 TaxID=2804617 RepID=UPI0026097631|nr:2Fe-2S iron-sulfur cluster-binding protein [Sphingomonas sp. LHG3406-1]
MTRMRVNGQAIEFAMDPATPLLWALRDAANLTGTKQGCGGTGTCGACTVIVDGASALSCLLPIGSLEGADVTTVEGLASHPVALALVAEDAVQCGFCLPGFVCAVAALLQQSPRPSPEQVDALPILCSCGAQPRLRRAIERAAASMAASSPAPAPEPAAAPAAAPAANTPPPASEIVSPR